MFSRFNTLNMPNHSVVAYVTCQQSAEHYTNVSNAECTAAAAVFQNSTYLNKHSIMNNYVQNLIKSCYIWIICSSR